MKIGLVGEAPNDTSAIQNLLSRKYKQLEFVTLLNRINGSMLDNHKAISRLLRIEYETAAPDLVIFIRDLDSLERDKIAKKRRQEIFTYSNRIVNKKGLHLLNIYELEALILADIDVFNKQYDCVVKAFDDPMAVEMPKEVLKEGSAYRYNETDNPKIFELLNFEILKKNCHYFALFVTKFERQIL